MDGSTMQEAVEKPERTEHGTEYNTNIHSKLERLLSQGILRVRRVYFDDESSLNQRTKDLILGFLSPIYSCQDMHCVFNHLKHVSDQLEDLNIIKDMDSHLVLDPYSNGDSDQNEPIRYDIKLSVRPKRLHLKAGTEIRQNEPMTYLGGTWYNIFGGGERINANMSYGTRTSSPFSMEFLKPLFLDPTRILSFGIYQNLHRDFLNATHTEGVTGLSAGYRTWNNLGSHSFLYDLSWRNMFSISKEASMGLRRLSGHSIKSSIRYAWILDKRNDPFLPSKGYQLKLVQELAGFLNTGTIQFSKTELGYQFHIPVTSFATVSLSSRGAFIIPYGKTSSTSYMDRIFLGGPLSVRGFSMNGIGPHDNSDSLGGDIALENSVMFSFPLVSQVRGHVFWNSGNLVPFSKEILLKKTAMKQFISDSAMSIGYGLALRIPNTARLEINFAFPFSSAVDGESRKHNRGIQFGVGLEFL